MSEKEIRIESIKWLLPKCKYAYKTYDKGLMSYRLGLLIKYTEELIKTLESEATENDR